MKITHHTAHGEVIINNHKCVEDAPVYTKKPGEFKTLTLTNAEIVEGGTEKGNATVDLVFVDDTGQKYVALLMGSTAHIIGGMAQPIK